MTITLTREEAQQVLDALRAVEDLTTHDDEVYAAIDIIEPLLAQPEPEAVAWMHDQKVGFNVPLYTAPPQREWQGLEIDEVKATAELGIYEKPLIDFARAIEAKLKEKNT